MSYRANYSTSDYYKILGISPQTPDEKIKPAYVRASRKYHPDMHNESEFEKYNAMMAKVNEAYEVLTTDREEFDRVKREQAQQEQPPAPARTYNTAASKAAATAPTKAKDDTANKAQEEQTQEATVQAAQEKKHALTVLHRYDAVFIFVYTIYFLSIMPCADLVIGRWMIAEEKSKPLSEIIGTSGKAAVILCWAIYWVSFLVLGMVIAKRDRDRTGKITVGRMPKVYALLLAVLGLVVFGFPRLAETVCKLYDELRSFFSISPYVFGVAALLICLFIPRVMMNGITKHREIYNDIT